jgi:hypothetical protein
MADHDLIRRIRLGAAHRPTGRTRHFVHGELAPVPVELRIVQYEGDPGYYLLYCDESGTEFTDTYHGSLEGAMSQAEWEFGTKADEWEADES